jgi:hypothetical protein
VSNNYADQRLIPARIRRFILPPDGPVCFYCGLRLASEIDHVIPVSRGGSAEPQNLVAACYPCNHDKSDRSVSEWFRDIGLAVETALLHRFRHQRPFDEPPKRPDRFGDLIDQLDKSDPTACWPWPFDMYRTQVHRRVYERLRGSLGGPLETFLVHRGARLTGAQCVNPDHYEAMTRDEHRSWSRVWNTERYAAAHRSAANGVEQEP